MLRIRLSLNINLVLNHEPLGLYGIEQRVLLRKGKGESLRHVLMKLMGYMMFYHESLVIEGSAHQHYKPDLVRLDEQGDPVQWVDCGYTAIRKLNRITQKNYKTMVDIIKPTPTELRLYKTQAERKLRYPERVRHWSFAPDFIQKFSNLVTGRHELTVSITSDMSSAYLLIDEQTLYTPIIFMAGGLT